MDNIEYVLKHLKHNACLAPSYKQALADSILGFWELIDGNHRFVVHAYVFREEEPQLIEYIRKVTARETEGKST